MADFVPDLRGVTAEEVQRRRRCVSNGNNRGRVWCTCACHATKPLTGSAREKHERKKAA